MNLAPNGAPEFLHTPSQVAISPDRHTVVVATKTHGALLSYALGADGHPAASPTTTPSGTVPFTLDSTAGPTGEAAAAWTVLIGGTLYAANAGSNSITAFTGHQGVVTIGEPVAATTGAGPIDLAASVNGRWVHQLTGGSGQVDEYVRGADGSLTTIGTPDTGLGAGSGMPVEGIGAS